MGPIVTFRPRSGLSFRSYLRPGHRTVLRSRVRLGHGGRVAYHCAKAMKGTLPGFRGEVEGGEGHWSETKAVAEEQPHTEEVTARPAANATGTAAEWQAAPDFTVDRMFLSLATAP